MVLRALGWEEAKRGRVAIWQTPDKGLYHSQEMAVEMDREGAKPHVPRRPGGGT